MTTATPEMLTVADMARILRRDPQTIRRYAQRKILHGSRPNGGPWLFEPDEPQRFMAGETVDPAPAPRPTRNPRKYPNS